MHFFVTIASSIIKTKKKDIQNMIFKIRTRMIFLLIFGVKLLNWNYITTLIPRYYEFSLYF